MCNPLSVESESFYATPLRLYLREQAVKYRDLAKGTEQLAVKQEFFDLAVVCEEVADQIDDRRASG